MTQEEKDRREKVKRLREAGIQPYVDSFSRTHFLAEAKKLKDDTEKVAVAGRILQLRLLGKLAFLRLSDESGEYQIVLEKEALGEDRFKFWTKNIDIGDFVGATGKTFTTKHGEPSLLIADFTLLTKALAPLPEKFHGLTDVEKKYRERYLDLATSRESLDRFKKRSQIVKTLRDFFDVRGFIEVETPILQTKPSGAVATPFFTHHNALDLNCVLRIAPETYLKRCLVGGFERVYEFARCFRNEGIDPTHLQDFTMLELYVAYENYEFLIQLAEEMFADLVKKALSSPQIEFMGQKIDLNKKWERIDIVETLNKAVGLDIEQADAKQLCEAVKRLKLDVPNLEKLGTGNLIDALYKKTIREKIVQPTIVTGHPVSLSPLSRRNDKIPERVDRFQLVIAGWEVINGFSELTDADDQAERFTEQAKARKAGDTEAMESDDDFVQALAHGMPPAAGWGIGIDRLVALLTGQENLKDVVLFPLMRPEK